MVFQKSLIASLIKNSERTAIDNNGILRSYAELFSRANAVSRFLLKQSLPANARVGVFSAERETIITAMIGIMNAGFVFIPLDPGMPVKRREAMLAELAPDCLISDAGKAVAGFDFNTIIQNPAANSGETVYPEFNADDSIYIYFTSGSTGKPKGIIGRNKSLLQYLQWQIREFSLDENCRVSQLISPYFDAFLRDVFVPLLTGGTICLPPADEDFFTTAKMAEWIGSSQITDIHCVPSVFRIINEGAIAGTQFPHLHHIMMSGEKINPSELQHWYSLFGDRIQLVNFYGATETTMIRSFYRIKPEDAQKPKISIGSPIDDTRLLVLNRQGKICPPYVPGDLYIATPFITKGYLGDETLTVQKFVTLFAGTAGECIAFKTGDKARVVEDGNIDLLGREDRQLKIRGIRVEPEEIEYVMLQSGLLKNALVFTHAAIAGDEFSTADDSNAGRLMAFVICNADAGENWKAQLKAVMKDSLPGYMIPSGLVAVDEYPLLPNGKINYRELLAAHAVTKLDKPENETEEKLLQIWKEVLGDKEISTSSSFQEAGGNSLSIMRLIAKVYRVYNVRISLNDIFNHLTIQRQAKLVQQLHEDKLLHIQPVPRKDVYAVSSAQERIYYQYIMNKAGTAFNMPMAWEVDAGADLNKLVAAFAALVRRHESLRTRFILQDNQLLQVIDEEAVIEIKEMEMPAGGVEELIKPFDLSTSPLIRCAVLSRGNGKKILFTDIHHIVCDGMSQVNLYSDLLQLYEGDTLRPLSLQYKDYAEWEKMYKLTDDYISHRGFWLQAFEGEFPRLPLTAAGETAAEMQGGSSQLFINREVLLPLLKQWQQAGITRFSGLLSLYFIFMAQYSGQDDIIVGINTTGRMQDELEDTVGMFAKTLPIRFQINPLITVNEFSNQVHQYLWRANTRQLYDYADIVNELNRNREKPSGNLFDTMLVYQNFAHRYTGTADGILTDYHFRQPEAKYPITLFISEAANGFHFRIDYQLACFNEDEIKILQERLEKLLLNAAANSNLPIINCIDTEAELNMVNKELAFQF
jgi:mycobactin peptide synthetase MbtE